MLYHIRIGRTLNYHEVPPHLYWKEKSKEPPACACGRSGSGALRAGRWRVGRRTASFDRFVKNTYEILSPLYELTARMQMTKFEFLTPDRTVTRSVFGEGKERVESVVNTSAKPFPWKSRTGGEVVLPPQGFVVESPAFVAFHALELERVELPVCSAVHAPVRATENRSANPVRSGSTTVLATHESRLAAMSAMLRKRSSPEMKAVRRLIDS